jgi:hypothetical protein
VIPREPHQRSGEWCEQPVCKAKLKGRLPVVFKNASHAFVVNSRSAAPLTLHSVPKSLALSDS